MIDTTTPDTATTFPIGCMVRLADPTTTLGNRLFIVTGHGAPFDGVWARALSSVGVDDGYALTDVELVIHGPTVSARTDVEMWPFLDAVEDTRRAWNVAVAYRHRVRMGFIRQCDHPTAKGREKRAYEFTTDLTAEVARLNRIADEAIAIARLAGVHNNRIGNAGYAGYSVARPLDVRRRYYVKGAEAWREADGPGALLPVGTIGAHRAGAGTGAGADVTSAPSP